MKAPTLILLVRHALTATTGTVLTGRAPGLHLSDDGPRQAAALARLVERHPGVVVVAVSHADPIKAAVAHALGVHLDLFQRIVIAPASITAIAYRSQSPLVLTLNSMDGDLAGLLA